MPRGQCTRTLLRGEVGQMDIVVRMPEMPCSRCSGLLVLRNADIQTISLEQAWTAHIHVSARSGPIISPYSLKKWRTTVLCTSDLPELPWPIRSQLARIARSANGIRREVIQITYHAPATVVRVTTTSSVDPRLWFSIV